MSSPVAVSGPQEAIALSEGQRAALRRARGCLLSVMAQLMAQRREVRVLPLTRPRLLCSRLAVSFIMLQLSAQSSEEVPSFHHFAHPAARAGSCTAAVLIALSLIVQVHHGCKLHITSAHMTSFCQGHL